MHGVSISKDTSAYACIGRSDAENGLVAERVMEIATPASSLLFQLRKEWTRSETSRWKACEEQKRRERRK
jgi:hypothetical protein